MSETNYSNLLRQLVADYLDHRVSRVEYLAQRRGLLDCIDREFNGDDCPNGWPTPDADRLPPSGDAPEDTLVPKP
jgi:hypothetical protein